MTFEVLTARWDQIIRRVTAGIGPGSRVSETLSELFPVLDVENVPGELLILGQTDICMGGGQLGATAGNRASVQLFNPADSGKLVTCSSLIFSNSVTMDIRGSFFPVGGAGTITGGPLFRDLRRGEVDLPTGQIRSRNIAAQVLETFSTRVAGSTAFSLRDTNSLFVLAPGTGFEIQGQTVAAGAMNVTFWWRERVAVQSELNF